MIPSPAQSSPIRPKRSALPRLALGLKVALSVTLLYLAVRNLALDAILQHIRATRPGYLVIVLLIFAGNNFLLAWRWSRLSLNLISRSEALKYTWIGFFFGAVIPGAVSGDIAKGISLAFRNQDTRTSLLPTSIILDKLIGLSVVALFFILAVIGLNLTSYARSPAWDQVLWVLAGMAGAALLVAGLLGWLTLTGRWQLRLPSPKSERFQSVVSTLNAIPSCYQGRSADVFAAIAFSIMVHCGNALGYWLILASMGIDAPWIFPLILYSVLSFLMAVPISVSGIGVRDVAASSLFTGFAMHAEAGVALSWVILGISVPMILIGGAVQVVEVWRGRRKLSTLANPAPSGDLPP